MTLRRLLPGALALAPVVPLLSCASAPSAAAQGVSVFKKESGYGAKASPLPAGCRMLAAHPGVDQTELDLATTEFRLERERAAAAGANVLIAQEEMIVPRRNYDCPEASPITDCPPSEGAWFRVIYEDYDCSPEALGELRQKPAR
jgi:hypothetical protein